MFENLLFVMIFVSYDVQIYWLYFEKQWNKQLCIDL